MKTNRLEAFSDGVLAIIITIMVLQMKAPEGVTIKDLIKELPGFISYLLSFVYIGIYWNNHHHLLQITKRVNGKMLWANLHLLFWLSLVPFATSWIGENHVEALPVSLYGFVLFMSGIAFSILKRVIISNHADDKSIIKLFNNEYKPVVTISMYFIGMFVAFYNPWIAIACYVLVTLVWVIPNRKIEKKYLEF